MHVPGNTCALGACPDGAGADFFLGSFWGLMDQLEVRLQRAVPPPPPQPPRGPMVLPKGFKESWRPSVERVTASALSRGDTQTPDRGREMGRWELRYHTPTPSPSVGTEENSDESEDDDDADHAHGPGVFGGYESQGSNGGGGQGGEYVDWSEDEERGRGPRRRGKFALAARRVVQMSKAGMDVSLQAISSNWIVRCFVMTPYELVVCKLQRFWRRRMARIKYMKVVAPTNTPLPSIPSLAHSSACLRISQILSTTPHVVPVAPPGAGCRI